MPSDAKPPEPPRRPPATAELAVFGTQPESHALSRRLVTSRDGRVRQIFLAIPTRKPPAAGYRALYLLDGNAAFDVLTPAALAAVPGLALIGIGHDGPLRFDVTGRVLDYTPPRGPGDPSPDPQRPERTIGGGALFLEELTGELRLQAETGVAIDPAARALWGHSMAGLFVTYTMLTRPSAFARYAPASPSIWWEGEWMLGLESRTPVLANASVEALVMLGDSERRSNPAGPHWEGPAPHTLEMVERLRQRPGYRIDSRIFVGLGHAATLPASLPLAMEFAAG